jgi:hypothetical protein
VEQRRHRRTGDYNFSMEKEMKIINWEQGFFVHHRIVSAIKRVEFVDDDFKKGYQPRTNIVKDEKGDLGADSHSILAR